MPSPHVKRLPPQEVQSVVQLGLRANWQQFTLLVIVNAFVGGMVGLERSIVPLLGQRVFGLASTTAVLSFIVSFGIVKAAANLFAGRLSDRIGRKGVLVAGWLVGLPVPFLIIFAPSWGWVVFANVLLGINQGLCWSTTVIMKIDLVGPARRGLAMGFNEAAGYGAVSLAAIAAGYLAATYALRPQPFLLGIGFALAGLLLSLVFVRESHGHARHEAALLAHPSGQLEGSAPSAPAVTADRPTSPSFHEQVAVLNGRWTRWVAEGWPISTEVPWPAPTRFTPRPQLLDLPACKGATFFGGRPRIGLGATSPVSRRCLRYRLIVASETLNSFTTALLFGLFPHARHECFP